MTRVAVIDIGKTNAKLALVDGTDLSEIAVLTRPNTVLPGPPWPHYDVEGHWEFILNGLAHLHKKYRIDAISVTTHGACVALLDEGGALAAPILDYEHEGPDETADAYSAIRPAFADTGSPRLPGGLNVGAQIHWQFAVDPALRARTAIVLTYPQYWGHRLTGVAASDVCSLGCHTDLWEPVSGRFSSLVEVLGLTGRMAPPLPPAASLGAIRPDVARRTGLPESIPVTTGIHDSNASLLPHLLTRDAPFSVVSTGTWVIAMSVGGAKVALDPTRDTLINVDAHGKPVRSARFMGGREFDLATGGTAPDPDESEIASVLDRKVLLTPSLAHGAGPFQGRLARWVGEEPPIGTPERSAATAFYLALVTAECLTLIGHRGAVLIEGPFGRNGAYRRMLAAATGCEVIATGGATGTSQGAALLFRGVTPPKPVAGNPLDDLPGSARAYIAAWRAEVGK